MGPLCDRLPDDRILSDPKYHGSWRPSAAAEKLWAANPSAPLNISGAGLTLHTKTLKNPEATAAVLILTGFNEPMAKYVEVAYELWRQRHEVVLYDHRGQGMSGREGCLPAHRRQNAHVSDFQGLVDDAAAVASAYLEGRAGGRVAHRQRQTGRRRQSAARTGPGDEARSRVGAEAEPDGDDDEEEEEEEEEEGGGSQTTKACVSRVTVLHVLGHSMGGLVALHAVRQRPDLFPPHDAKLALSCPMLDTVWGDAPPGLPRAAAKLMGRVGCALGLATRLPPAPGAKLSWWDPHKPIRGVCLTHDPGVLTWYWALRAMHPEVAMLGVTNGWARAMVGAQEALEAALFLPEVANPMLVLTAEADTFVKPWAHRALIQARPSSRCQVTVGGGSFHEPLFETRGIREATLEALTTWLRLDPLPAAAAASAALSREEEGGGGGRGGACCPGAEAGARSAAMAAFLGDLPRPLVAALAKGKEVRLRHLSPAKACVPPAAWAVLAAAAAAAAAAFILAPDHHGDEARRRLRAVFLLRPLATGP